MSKDLNQVTILGRLTKDPELTYTKNNTACCKFSIANNDSYKSVEEIKDYANFFDIEVWGVIGQNCAKYLKKGSQVAINGSLKQQRWQDKEGQTRSKIVINANVVQFIGSPNTNGNNNAKQNANNVADTFNADPWQDDKPQDDQDIPF